VFESVFGVVFVELLSAVFFELDSLLESLLEAPPDSLLDSLLDDSPELLAEDFSSCEFFELCCPDGER